MDTIIFVILGCLFAITILNIIRVSMHEKTINELIDKVNFLENDFDKYTIETNSNLSNIEDEIDKLKKII